jgi:L-methionine (R)-S-oxide reductase
MSATRDTYRGALEALDRVINREADSDAILRAAVDILHDRFESYSWVGIYFVEGEELVLGPWKGPQATEHVRIPIGQGVCGAAASSGRTEIVDDVAADPRYLACFPGTRSEIVVPVRYEGSVVAEIDIDSDEPAAFGDEDRVFLERFAMLISPYCLVGWDTGGVDWDEPDLWEDGKPPSAGTP